MDDVSKQMQTLRNILRSVQIVMDSFKKTTELGNTVNLQLNGQWNVQNNVKNKEKTTEKTDEEVLYLKPGLHTMFFTKFFSPI